MPTWNQNTTGTASNITASSNSTLTNLSSLVSVAGGTFGSCAFRSSGLAELTGSRYQTTGNIALTGNDPGNGVISFRNSTNGNRTYKLSAGKPNVNNSGFSLSCVKRKRGRERVFIS